MSYFYLTPMPLLYNSFGGAPSFDISNSLTGRLGKVCRLEKSCHEDEDEDVST